MLVSKQKNGMFAFKTTQHNWSVLLRGFEYLKYVRKVIKSTRLSEERNKAIEESANKEWNFRKRRKSM